MVAEVNITYWCDACLPEKRVRDKEEVINFGAGFKSLDLCAEHTRTLTLMQLQEIYQKPTTRALKDAQPKPPIRGGDISESFPCLYCEKTFHTKYLRNKHLVREHGSDVPLMLENLTVVRCPVCGQKFASVTALTTHAGKQGPHNTRGLIDLCVAGKQAGDPYGILTEIGL